MVKKTKESEDSVIPRSTSPTEDRESAIAGILKKMSGASEEENTFLNM